MTLGESVYLTESHFSQLYKGDDHRCLLGHMGFLRGEKVIIFPNGSGSLSQEVAKWAPAQTADLRLHDINRLK